MAALQGRSLNDRWSAYKIGDEVKIVYHKVGRAAGEETGPRVRSDAPSAQGEGRAAPSISRTRSRVFELAACNSWQYFVTLTLDAAMRDRFDLVAFRKAFAMWVRNLNRRRKDAPVRYLLVPELHKNGAWHMHGFLTGLVPGEDIVRNEHRHLDWPGYRARFGFCNLQPIRDNQRAAAYVTKYVGKGFGAADLAAGADLYYRSQGLQGAECLVYLSADPCPVAAARAPDWENDYVAVYWEQSEKWDCK